MVITLINNTLLNIFSAVKKDNAVRNESPIISIEKRREARNLFKQSRFIEAAEVWRRETSKHPNDIEANFGLGLNCLKAGISLIRKDKSQAAVLLREARDVNQKVITLNINDFAAWNNLGVSFYALWEVTGNRDYGNEAERCFRNSITKDSRSSCAYYNLVSFPLSRGNIAEASKLLAVAVGNKLPKKYISFGSYYIGQSLYNSGNYEAAISRFNTSHQAGLDLSKKQMRSYLATAHFSVGAEAYLKDNMSKAIRYLNKISTYKADYHPPVMYAMLGNAYLTYRKNPSIADLRAGVANLTRAVRYGFDPKLIYFNRGVAYVQLKEFNNAVRDLNAHSPKNHITYFWLGNAYYDTRRYRQAITYYSRAINMSPSFKEAYFNRFLCNYFLKNYSLARLDLNKALQLSPGHPTYLGQMQMLENAEKIEQLRSQN